MSTISSVLNNSQPTNTNKTGGDTSKTDALASKQTFLQLLVAQIKNQDPTSPTDPTQFVSQLAQYSELEQLISINQGVEKINTPATTDTAKTDTAKTGSNPAA